MTCCNLNFKMGMICNLADKDPKDTEKAFPPEKYSGLFSRESVTSRDRRTETSLLNCCCTTRCKQVM
ncbi:uncharacterized protein isoform X1 [Musca autumnalis]